MLHRPNPQWYWDSQSDCCRTRTVRLAAVRCLSAFGQYFRRRISNRPIPGPCVNIPSVGALKLCADLCLKYLLPFFGYYRRCPPNDRYFRSGAYKQSNHPLYPILYYRRPNFLCRYTRCKAQRTPQNPTRYEMPFYDFSVRSMF